jgi:hypothetical protein
MPFFKTTKDILITPWQDELFNPNWMDSDTIQLPPKRDWDYSREMSIEDVDIWEVLYLQSGNLGVYVSWSPFAEFYMVTLPGDLKASNRIETYYGSGAQLKVVKRAKELGVPLTFREVWVEDDQMWLYPEQQKLIPNSII